VRWPTATGLATTAARTHKPGALEPDLAEQRRNPVTPPIFHVRWITIGASGGPEAIANDPKGTAQAA
jgi:hypothetical protein